ncbi:MAG TPA: ABC transporter permease [Cytophagales bacterium]|nr:ABC transporter permease [Cytophagales bacterium]
MNPIILIHIAWKALLINKMRAFLTMLGIIIGVASVIAMLAIGEGSKEGIKQQISKMGANMITIRPGAPQQGGVRLDNSASQTLTLKDVQALRNEAMLLTHISPQVNKNGQAIAGSYNWPTSIYGVAPEYLPIRVLALESGSMFTEADVRSAAKVLVIGQTVVENLFPEGEQPVGKTIRFNNIPFRVIGVLTRKGESTFGQDQDNIMLAPYTSVQKRLLANTYLQSIIASAQSEDQATAAVEEINTIMRKSHKLNTAENDFNVFSQQELISTFSATSEMLTVLLVAIASISLLVGGIGIMNIMYVSVKERTREIGLRMAVGGKGIFILLQFLVEAIFISVTGGVIGVALGLGATAIIATTLGWPVKITIFSIVVSFVVCTITGVFFGWYPAKKASELDPITALRFE